MNYVYFVYYVFFEYGYQKNGNIEMTINKKIEDIQTIKEIEKELERLHPNNTICVQNYKLLRKEK